MSEDKIIICHFDKDKFIPCKCMNTMIDSATTVGIGVNVAHIVNFKTMKEYDKGVYFQFSKRATEDNKLTNRKVMFNVCPFCESVVLKGEK